MQRLPHAEMPKHVRGFQGAMAVIVIAARRLQREDAVSIGTPGARPNAEGIPRKVPARAAEAAGKKGRRRTVNGGGDPFDADRKS
jgi:hypothetical protein